MNKTEALISVQSKNENGTDIVKVQLCVNYMHLLDDILFYLFRQYSWLLSFVVTLEIY